MSDRERFLAALEAFTKAGRALSDAWDGDNFNADDDAPLPANIRPPLSFDEWIEAFSAHYEEALA